MALFDRDDNTRKEVGLAVAMAAHFERNIPELFKQATTDRLENAADELLGDEDISFETVTVVRRIQQSLNARNPGRPWSSALLEALSEFDEDD